jgi:pilus assembly protein CpaC
MHTSRRLTLLTCLAIGAALFPDPERAAIAQPLPATNPGPAAAPSPTHPGDRAIRLSAAKMELSLIELQSRVVETEARIRLVDDFNPSIVSVTALAPNQLRIRGESPGITSIRIADEFDHVYQIEVMVERDLRELEANLRRLFPGSSVTVVGVRDSIVLRGWVTQPSQIPQIVELARTYAPNVQNHIIVGGGSQVVLSCRVMEVQRSKLEQLGFNFLAMGQNYYLASTPGGLAPIGNATLPFGGPPTVTTLPGGVTNSTIQFAVLGSSDIFRGFIEALKQESLLKILAEPTVTTTSGRPAELHSGGEFPILVPQGVGTATISFRDFGIRLETVPIVLGNGRVQLDIAAEVSERDFSNSVDVSGVRVPGISNRLVNTRVEMNFGETFMLGGLTMDRVTSSTNKVPVLGDVPYLGAAFSRKTLQNSTTELIILVTPHLSAPLSDGQVPCNGPGLNSGLPTCKEFHLDGHVEVPRFGAGAACPPGGECPPGMIGPGGFSGMGSSGFPAMTGGGTGYAPGMNYAAGMPVDAGPNMAPMTNDPSGGPSGPYPAPADAPLSPPPGESLGPAPELPGLPSASAGWPASGLSPSISRDFRSAGQVRTVGAGPTDLATPSATAGGTMDPGLIARRRPTSSAQTFPRSAPQYVGSSSISR